MTIRGLTELPLPPSFRRHGQQAHPDPNKWLRTLQDTENYLDYLAAAGRIAEGEAFLRETEGGFIAEIAANRRRTRFRVVTVVVGLLTTVAGCATKVWTSLFS